MTTAPDHTAALDEQRSYFDTRRNIRLQPLDTSYIRRHFVEVTKVASHSQNGLAFTRMQKLFEQLQSNYPKLDTLSMGMSDDFPLAIAHGANLVRIGSALFGPRPVKKEYS